MKIGKIMTMVGVISIMFLSYVPLASAQHLMDDEVWLKMKMSFKGQVVNVNTPSSPYVPLTNVATIYARFWPSTVDPYIHFVQLWSIKPNTGLWDHLSQSTLNTYGDGKGVVSGWYATWINSFDVFNANLNGTMKIKREGAQTKSATFTSMGCHVWGYSVSEADNGYVGSCKATGKKIDPSTLPFTPTPLP